MGGYALTGPLIALGLGLAALALFLAARCIRHGREAQRLHGQIMDFLGEEMKAPAFSVRDNSFALFENAVIELQARLIQSEENHLARERRSEALLVDISHQLKTPISGLRLYCEMDGGAHLPQQLQLLARMEHLIGSLLRLERLRADGFAFRFEMRELSAIAKEAAARVSPLFPGRSIEVIGAAQMSLDEGWMGEALANLIKNACEHTPAGGRIAITIQKAEASVSCVVQDEGGGVPPEEIGSLFRRFFRSSANHEPDGAGVGLAIVRAIVQKHHGTVSAKNAGGGLEVTMCLPIFHHRLKKT